MSASTQSANGRLALHFSRNPAHGQTILHVREQQPPLRVIRAFPIQDGAALVHLHNVSGGVLGGDQLQVMVQVGASANVQLTSTGATRIYGRRSGHPAATQQTSITVEQGGLLEYLPDLLIPFAGAHYHQQTTIDLAEGAGLFYWEVVAPGREARAEIFAYEQLHLHLDIRAAGRPIVLERLQLQPALRPLTSPARLGIYRYFATFYACQVGTTAVTWRDLEEKLTALADALTLPGDILWGVSTLAAHGLTVRALSRTSRAITAGLPQFWQSAKQALYQQPAILPRKTY